MWPNPQLPFPFLLVTAWKISKYGVCPNTEKYGPGKIQYLDTFHAKSFLLGLFLQNPMGRTNWFEQNTVTVQIRSFFWSVFFCITFVLSICIYKSDLETIVLLLACSNFFVFVQHVEACSRTLLSIYSVTPSPYFRKK